MDALNTFLAELFTRQAFTAKLLARNYNQISGWIELGCVIALMAATFWLTGVIIKRHMRTAQNFQLLRHIGRRILWPILMLAGGTAALLACNLYGYQAVWLQLLVLAARWMILIRISVAVVHAALPQNKLTDWLERAVSTALWVGFVLWISEVDDKIIDFLKNIQFSVGSTKLNLFNIINGLIWVAILMVFAMWLARSINARLAQSSLDNNLRMILAKVINTAMMVLAVLIALPLVGIDLTVLSVFGGALGVGIGFGLQKVASNYVSGFIILGDRSIRINDRLTVNDFTGYVTQITSRFVVLRNANGTEALIPNENFVTSMVINESYTSKELQQSLTVQVAYHSDLTRALEILKKAAANQERVIKDPEPLAVVTDFADNGINLYLGFWVRDPENGFLGLKSAILLDIWKQFNENNIEFPFPQREIRILNEAQSPSDIAMLKAGIRAQRNTETDPALEDGSGGD
ncbi:mechanosensitive ion channel family protein [Neisseria chenwenguii]|uniref:Uncharacterized protein n=1 Tax=Neisseria chenwenguii TaxID=1853278 RepID=A0A220RZ22_9NEIS|nr:mechanosensitive ion channel domain-containing protein [Neisseria chenwenguii]ASK26417.1 hypothetical protein BG910_00455 [Neisseria chenwenguii]ROV55840.1 hypothetical protein EGS38_07955 [Neisseria chenwenguii]